MTRSEYTANLAMQSPVKAADGWMKPSTCVRRNESAVQRIIKAVFGF